MKPFSLFRLNSNSLGEESKIVAVLWLEKYLLFSNKTGYYVTELDRVKRSTISKGYRNVKKYDVTDLLCNLMIQVTSREGEHLPVYFDKDEIDTVKLLYGGIHSETI